jgi:hypothetical protein
MDLDGDGYITQEELKQALATDIPDAQQLQDAVREALRDADKDNDGRIDYMVRAVTNWGPACITWALISCICRCSCQRTRLHSSYLIIAGLLQPLLLLLLQEFASMMVPAYQRQCSAIKFANSWLEQQQAKQQHTDKQDWGDLGRGPSGIRVQRDQAPVPVSAS